MNSMNQIQLNKWVTHKIQAQTMMTTMQCIIIRMNLYQQQ